jgi:hypothetical protein
VHYVGLPPTSSDLVFKLTGKPSDWVFRLFFFRLFFSAPSSLLLQYNQQMAVAEGSETYLWFSRYYRQHCCRKKLRGSHILSHVSSVGVVTRLRVGRLITHRLLVGRGKRFLSCPKRPDRLWHQLGLVPSVYRQLFPHGKSADTGKLTTHLHVVPILRIHGANLYFPIRL